MKVNVDTVAKVNSSGPVSPTQYAMFLMNIVGKSASPDVSGDVLVADFISQLIVTFGFNALSASYSLEKNDVALDSTMTLNQCGVVENDKLKLRVILSI